MSVAEPLLNLLHARNDKTEEKPLRLEIKLGCLVKKILHKDGKAVALETSQGDFQLGDAKLILAMGVYPPTTLMLNSFPSLKDIGTRCSAHFRSSLIARAPLRSVVQSQNVHDSLVKKISQRPEVAAFYIPGTNQDSKRQFHIQLSAVLDATPQEDIEKTMRHYPDVIPVPSKDQLSSSKDPPHVIFLCKNIGELDPNNKDNWYRLNSEVPPDNDVNRSENSNITFNTTLQVVANDEDLSVWETLDESTFAILEGLESRDNPNSPSQLEYWHKSTGSWQKQRPPLDQIRSPDLVHEASTMWIGANESSPVGLDYRFRGVENVYLTGPALFPTTGSWNPTGVMAALAIHLADTLHDNKDESSKS
jgi:choline dehydrogenase-like flavoprotein